jgi:hypothetical protein
VQLTLRPRLQYETQQLRTEQATDAWQDRDGHRAGIEGISSRHPGAATSTRPATAWPKTHLQHVLTALALNLVRLDAWLTSVPPGGSWVSRLTRLRPALAEGSARDRPD